MEAFFTTSRALRKVSESLHPFLSFSWCRLKYIPWRIILRSGNDPGQAIAGKDFSIFLYFSAESCLSPMAPNSLKVKSESTQASRLRLGWVFNPLKWLVKIKLQTIQLNMKILEHMVWGNITPLQTRPNQSISFQAAITHLYRNIVFNEMNY